MRLAAVGSNCIDYYNNIDGGKAFPGGGPVNMAVYTLRLGGEAAYIGPVGDDVYGQIMIETIKAKGVDTSHLRVEKGKTAVTQVELIDGERVFGDYDEGVLEKYKLTDEDIDYIKNFDVVICDVWGKVEGQFKELKEKGIVTARKNTCRSLRQPLTEQSNWTNRGRFTEDVKWLLFFCIFFCSFAGIFKCPQRFISRDKIR